MRSNSVDCGHDVMDNTSDINQCENDVKDNACDVNEFDNDVNKRRKNMWIYQIIQMNFKTIERKKQGQIHGFPSSLWVGKSSDKRAEDQANVLDGFAGAVLQYYKTTVQ